MKQKSSFPCLVAICQPLNAGTQAHWGVGQHTVWRWPGLAGVTGNYSGCSPLLYVCIIYVCIIRNRILPWPASSMSIHTAIHTSICIQSIHIHHRVQYQSILLSNGQKNELISLGTLKSEFSLLCPRPFSGGEWSSFSPGTNTSAYVLTVSQASHSIQFNPSTTVNCGPADGN